MATFVPSGPYLQGLPNAQLAPVMMIPAVGYIYAALMIGIVPTSVAFIVSAVLLRRPLLALAGVAIGAVGFFLPLIVVLASAAVAAEPNMRLVFTIMQIVATLLGFGLYKLAHPHVRGHQLLAGKVMPLMWILYPAAAVMFLGPLSLRRWLELPIFMLTGVFS